MFKIDLFKGNELFQDIVMVIITIILLQLLIVINDFIKKKGWLSTTVTRKAIHILAAPVYVFMWSFYSNQWFSPYIAVIVPVLFAIQFILIGSGLMKNDKFVQSMCRTGDPKELLRGTLYYAIVMIFGTLFCWVSLPNTTFNPVGLTMFMVLAFGDGFADIVGRSINKMNFTVFSKKSVPGTIAMFIASFVSALAGLMYFNFPVEEMIVLVVAICLFSTIIEVVSPKELDNLTIPIIIMLSFVFLSPVLSPNLSLHFFSL